jgi:hypothetical protein
VTALTTGAALTAATGATAGLAFLADFSATTGAAATGVAATGAAAGATSVFLDTRFAAGAEAEAEEADLFIVLLPVVFWDIFKRVMTYIVFIPTVKFCG